MAGRPCSSQDLGNAIMGPLAFAEPVPQPIASSYSPFEIACVKCLLCSWQHTISQEDHQSMNNHMIAEHQLVVDDIEKIASYKLYFNYWQIKFSRTPVWDVCPQIPKDGNAFFLLSPAINTEDAALRNGLAAKRLEWILEQQARERVDNTFTRMCLFCKHSEPGTRAQYITHLRFQHNLQLGRPENLVFIDILIENLESLMRQLKCLYCGLTFKDRDTLKEHMRKKFHKRINPENKFFDRFYVKSYVEGCDDDEEDVKREEEPPSGVGDWSQWREEGSDWSDWQEEPRLIFCLFCNNRCAEWDEMVQHLLEAHRFDYSELKRSRNYYEQVKIVNFIRRERHLLRCYVCQERMHDSVAWICHVQNNQHCRIPERAAWDQPEFFFPTYENDSFLCCLEETEEDPVARLASQLGNATSFDQT